MQIQPVAAGIGGPPQTGRSTASGGRLSMRTLAIVGALVALVVIYATDQIVPASSERQAQVRLWLAARSTGVVAYLLLTFQVILGLILSHPTNKSTWKLSKAIFPWHDQLWIFIVAFLGVHVVSIVLDPYAGVGLGAFVPGLSEYRSAPVALGTLALYAFLITTLTARYTRLLPPGMWLTLHRVAWVVIALAWSHGVLAGTDSGALTPMYLITGLAIVAATGYRYWIVRHSRPLPAMQPKGSSS